METKHTEERGLGIERVKNLIIANRLRESKIKFFTYIIGTFLIGCISLGIYYVISNEIYNKVDKLEHTKTENMNNINHKLTKNESTQREKKQILLGIITKTYLQCPGCVHDTYIETPSGKINIDLFLPSEVAAIKKGIEDARTKKNTSNATKQHAMSPEEASQLQKALEDAKRIVGKQ